MYAKKEDSVCYKKVLLLACMYNNGSNSSTSYTVIVIPSVGFPMYTKKMWTLQIRRRNLVRHVPQPHTNNICFNANEMQPIVFSFQTSSFFLDCHAVLSVYTMALSFEAGVVHHQSRNSPAAVVSGLPQAILSCTRFWQIAKLSEDKNSQSTWTRTEHSYNTSGRVGLSFITRLPRRGRTFKALNY